MSGSLGSSTLWPLRRWSILHLVPICERRVLLRDSRFALELCSELGSGFAPEGRVLADFAPPEDEAAVAASEDLLRQDLIPPHFAADLHPFLVDVCFWILLARAPALVAAFLLSFLVLRLLLDRLRLAGLSFQDASLAALPFDGLVLGCLAIAGLLTLLSLTALTLSLSGLASPFHVLALGGA